MCWSTTRVCANRSNRRLEEAAERGLVINPMVYAELASPFATPEQLDASLFLDVEREDPPWRAAFVAGQAHAAYRRRGGERRSPLPDFFIGAHALVRGYALLTRDAKRYRTYFPTVSLICPDNA